MMMVMAVVTSCATQQHVVYLQDQVVDSKFDVVVGGQIELQPNDEISISVSSRNPELAAVFNKQRSRSVSSGLQDDLNYTIGSDGYIDFPVLGELYVAGMTRELLERDIKSRIITSDLIKDPVVTVEFINLSFSVVGEVAAPGRYYIDKDYINIFEALGMAGDLSIYGVRDRVFLTRHIDGQLITYCLDLRSKDIYSSPAYYLCQNDVIYVEPNKIRANQSTVNGNTVRSASFWMSLASLLTTVTLLIVK